MDGCGCVGGCVGVGVSVEACGGGGVRACVRVCVNGTEISKL